MSPPLFLPTVMGNWSVHGDFCLLLPSPTVFPLQLLTLFPPPFPVQLFFSALSYFPRGAASSAEGLGSVLLWGCWNQLKLFRISWNQHRAALTSPHGRLPLQFLTASTWAPAPCASTMIIVITIIITTTIYFSAAAG